MQGQEPLWRTPNFGPSAEVGQRPMVAYLVAVPIVLFPLAVTENRPLSAELDRSV
jgi:hypothetical protein